MACKCGVRATGSKACILNLRVHNHKALKRLAADKWQPAGEFVENPAQGARPMIEKKAMLVVCAGDATGGAIARRFAREGYIACVSRRQADKFQWAFI